jgi:lysozyme family protein
MMTNRKNASLLALCSLLVGCAGQSEYGRSFDSAVSKTLGHEGGYVNDSDDNGGETKYGISKRAHPNVDIKSLTVDQAKSIYYKEYWKAMDLDDVYNSNIAAKIFDICVNCGEEQAKEIVKRALQSVYRGKTFDSLNDWGFVIFLINNISNQEALLVAIRSEQAAVYRMIAQKDETQGKFLKGWLNRAYK